MANSRRSQFNPGPRLPMKFNPVGVRYCTAHHGIANEDMDECDFAVGESGSCVLRVLGYRTRRA